MKTRPPAFLPIPLPHEIDAAPQLVVVALAHAALVATQQALDSAHPILATTSRPGPIPYLGSDEHFAALIVASSADLANLLLEYQAAARLTLDDDDIDF